MNDTLTALDWVILALAVWRITNILFWEKIFAKFREHIVGGYFSSCVNEWEYPLIQVSRWEHNRVSYRLLSIIAGFRNFPKRVFSCFWCLSVWVSAATLVIYLVFEPLVILFSLSAVAILIAETRDLAKQAVNRDV